MGSKILVVEDSIVVNKHLEFILKSAGYHVHTAFSSQEATNFLVENQYDLVILDVYLDGKEDGILLGNQVSKQFDFPLIYLTGLSDKPTLDKAKQSHPYGYITKPFKESDILTSIEVALHKSKFEGEIRKSRDFLSTLIQHLNEFVILLSENDEVLFANPALEQLVGINFNSLRLQNINQFIEFYLDGKSTSIEEINDEKSSNMRGVRKEVKSKINGNRIYIGNILFEDSQVKSDEKITKILIFSDISAIVERELDQEEIRRKKLSLLIEGQENERLRISKEIHDGLGQELNLIKLKLSSQSVSEKLVKETLDLVDSALVEVKKISNNLLPSIIHDFDLPTCINYLKKQYQKQLPDVKISLITSEVPDLSLKEKINCFRVIQECVSNSLRHGFSENISIQLLGLQDSLQITIEDDGVGFDPHKIEQSSSHNGINIMRQRVDSLGGEMHIESNKKLGTFIHITIPK